MSVSINVMISIIRFVNVLTLYELGGCDLLRGNILSGK